MHRNYRQEPLLPCTLFTQFFVQLAFLSAQRCASAY